MSSRTTTTASGHPIAVAAAELHDRLDELTDQSTWSMTDAETRTTLTALTRLGARVAELELRVAAHAETTHVGDASGATSTAAWWATETHQTRAETHRKTTLATALDTPGHEPVRAALATGDVLPDQARVIVAAVDALPDDVDPTVTADGERFLLDQAHTHDAKALRVLGKRLLHVLDPTAGDAHEAAVLEREEADAAAAASLQMVDDGHGKTHGRFTIPTLHGAILKKALLALAAPKHRAAVDGHAPLPGRPSNHRLGEAFVEYLERYPTDRLPHAGGATASIVAMIDLDALLGRLAKAGLLDTGEKISPAAARHLACRHGLIPAVLDGASRVLDLGRKRRFHTPAQRLVFTLEQRGCTAVGCDHPPGLCHAHHPLPWSEGGETNRDGRLLCPRHHTLAHHPDYQTTYHPDGKVSFHRRQ